MSNLRYYARVLRLAVILTVLPSLVRSGPGPSPSASPSSDGQNHVAQTKDLEMPPSPSPSAPVPTRPIHGTLVQPGEYQGLDDGGDQVDIVFALISGEMKISALKITFGPDPHPSLDFFEPSSTPKDPFGFTRENGDLAFGLLVFSGSPQPEVIDGKVTMVTKSLWQRITGSTANQISLTLTRGANVATSTAAVGMGMIKNEASESAYKAFKGENVFLLKPVK